MKPVAQMVVAALVMWVALTLLLGVRSHTATLFGMAGPLVIAVVTWRLSEQTYRRDPTALTGLMIAGFVGKMVFFGAYVWVVIEVWSQPAVTFALSFTCSFIALHLIEALALRRLFAS
jgi:hypothetical protein